MPTASQLVGRLHLRHECRTLSGELATADAGPQRVSHATRRYALQECLTDYFAMDALRRLHRTISAGDLSAISDQQVVDDVMRALETGRVCACDRGKPYGIPVAGTERRPWGPPGPPAATAPPPSPGAPAPAGRPLRGRASAAPPPAPESEGPPKVWLEIEVVGEDDLPVPGLRYEVKLPNGSKREGVLDGAGRARFEELDPGNAILSFPDLDRDAWEAIA